MPTEKENQQKAFELYYSLGERRSYKQIAEQLGVSPSTVKHWSRSFGWRQRIRERDADVARKVADRTIQANVSEGERNEKIVNLALMRLAKAIAEGKVKMQLSDLDRLIRLRAFLTEQHGPEFDDPPPRTVEEYEETLDRLNDLPEMERMNKFMQSVPAEILAESINRILAKVRARRLLSPSPPEQDKPCP